MSEITLGYAMLQYGSVQRWGRTAKSSETSVLPAGEIDPPIEHWLDMLNRAQTTDDILAIMRRALAELEAWRRRPDPPPPPESFDDLKRRIVIDGEGWTPQEVALAMRVTPTLVRNVRREAEREEQYGRPDGSLSQGLQLLATGMSLRQVAQITGIPKSTLHDARRSAA
jgi:hypothetical protein